MKSPNLVAGGTMGTLNVLDIVNIAGPSTIRGINSAMNNGDFIRHVGVAPARFGGAIQLSSAGGAADWSMSRVGANVASLAAGASLRIMDNASLFLGDIGDVGLNWNGTALEFDPVVGGNLTFRPYSNYWKIGEGVGGIQIDAQTIVLGTPAADPTSSNFFAMFAGPNLRGPTVGGEYSGILWTASGTIDIGGFAMSDVQADKINSPSTILSGGSIQDISNVYIAAMPSANATRSQALRVLGRSRLDGMVCHKSSSPAQITADQDDYALPANNGGRHVLRFTSDATWSITGFLVSLSSAQTGDSFWFLNVGAEDIILTHEDVSSTASNRIHTNDGLDHVVGPDQAVMLWHDDVSDRWRMLAPDHEVLDGFDEITTPASTTSGTLVDITGLTFDLVTTRTGKINAAMTFQASTTGGSPATGAWTISINSADGTEMARYLSGTNDTGIGAAQTRSVSLPPGTYTVVGRHRRVSGASTLNTDAAQLHATFIAD